MSVEVDVLYQGGLRCAATHQPSGQTLTTDAPVDNGGRGEAFSPTDLIATGLGTCILTIMGLAAQHSGLDLSGTRMHVIKEMAAKPLRRIGALTVLITLPEGKPISPTDRVKLERAAELCPVKQSLHPDIDIHIEFAYPS